MSFPFRSRFTHAWPQQPYLLRSSASIISPSSPRITSSAGLAVFSKKSRLRSFGCYTPPLPVSQELPFFSPAEFSDTFLRRMMTNLRLSRSLRTPTLLEIHDRNRSRLHVGEIRASPA